MKEQWFDVGQTPNLEISCNGDLVIQTGTDSSLVTRAEGVSVDGSVVSAESDLKMLIPPGSSLNVLHVHGDLKIKGVDGSVTIGEVAGDAGFGSVGGAIDVQTVHGDLNAISVSGGLTVNSVNGDLTVRSAGHVTARMVHGDVSVQNVDHAVEITGAAGDVAIKAVGGALTVRDVHGDCAIDNVSGVASVQVKDDIRIKGPLGPGKHSFVSDSTITLRWPPHAPIALVANAPDIHNRMGLTVAKQDDRMVAGSIGDGQCTVELTAANRITLRNDARSESRSDWENYMDFEFDMAGFGERISAEINAKMADLTDRVGPEISVQIERAMRQAQDAIQKVADRIENEVEIEINRDGVRAKPRPKRGRPKADATPPPPAPPEPPAPDVSQAQIKILKMLEEGKLTVDEANDLLASLG